MQNVVNGTHWQFMREHLLLSSSFSFKGHAIREVIVNTTFQALLHVTLLPPVLYQHAPKQDIP
jgi:hypothetical protein